jgi:ABC-type amino acid transport substrate-binding protein
MIRGAALVGVIAALGVAGAVAAATGAQPDWPDALAGRLQRIKETGVVRLGYRENAIPFSYLGAGAQPVGYSIDLCKAVVATIADDLGGATPAIEYVPVTAQDRITLVVSGAVDLECGATTNTAERRKEVAFSPTIFVTGTRIAVPRGSAIRDYADLAGRKVCIVRGTTNEAAMREIDRLRGLRIEFVSADDYREALALLLSGSAEALAADDVLLRGVLAEAGKAREVRLVGDVLAFEPYGIMYARDDPGLAAAVDRTIRDLAANREIVWLYNRWFIRPLPSGQRLDLPMGPQLRRSLELLGLPSD